MSALPAAITISQLEDLVFSFTFVDDATGNPIDITGGGFGSFSMTLNALAVYNVSTVIFPSTNFSLALVGGTTNQITLVGRLANLTAMLPGVQFAGELIRTISGSPVVTESWATVSVVRSSPAQSTDNIGSHAITVRRTAGNTVLVRTSLVGPTGPAGPANTLTVSSTTTLATGSSATAVISGTAPNQSIAFGIPAGTPTSLALILALG